MWSFKLKSKSKFSLEKITIQTMRSLYQEPDIITHFRNPHRNIKNTGLCEWELSLLKEYTGSKGHVLVIGCAGGQESFAYLRAGYQVTGIDIVPEFIQEAKEQARKKGFRKQARFIVVDGYKWPVKDNKFDAVSMMANFLIHLPTRKIRKTVFKECYRVLRKGGVALMEGDDRLHPSKKMPEPDWVPPRPENKKKKKEWNLVNEPGAMVVPFHPCKGDANAKTLAPTYTTNPREVWDELESCCLRVIRVESGQDAKERFASTTIVAVKD